MEASYNKTQFSQGFEYNGIHYEISKKNPSSLKTYFHDIFLGEVHLGGMFSWGRAWSSITPQGNTKFQGKSFTVSTDDLNKVQESANNLNVELVKLLETDFSKIDFNSARRQIDSILKTNGLNTDLLEAIEKKIFANEVVSADAMELIFFT